MNLPEGYCLKAGATHDRPLLREFLEATFRELEPERTHFEHLDQTLTKFFDQRHPLWWVVHLGKPVGCLWLGTAWDQFSGERTMYVFLLYVRPEHRRLGLGRFLLEWAEDIARGRGDAQVTLQVFPDSHAALALYTRMGFGTRALFLSKAL